MLQVETNKANFNKELSKEKVSLEKEFENDKHARFNLAHEHIAKRGQ